MSLTIAKAASTLVVLSLAQVKIKGSFNMLFKPTLWWIVSNVRGEPTLGPDSAFFGCPWSVGLLVHYSSNERRPDFAKSSSDCGLPSCFFDSGKPDPSCFHLPLASVSMLPNAAHVILFAVQVSALLCIADYMVHCLWRRNKDPDSYSIPYLTALGDLLGTALLALAFLILWCIGDSGSV